VLGVVGGGVGVCVGVLYRLRVPVVLDDYFVFFLG